MTRITIPSFHRSQENGRARAAGKLAANLAKALPAILDQFQARRREILVAGRGDVYPREGVAALLDSTESRLARELGGAELVPVRDYVAETFQTARRDLGLAARTALRHSPARGWALASSRSAAEEPAPVEGRLERSVADPVLDRIEAFLKEVYLRSTKKDWIVDLCVVSKPKEGAMVSLHSKSGGEQYQKKTTGRLESLFRSKYRYSVDGRGFRPIDCQTSASCLPIDLWDKRQPVLTFDLSEGTCDVREGNWPESCRR